jgi:hypothetical protein
MISIVEHVIDFDTIDSNYIPKNKSKVLVMQRGMDGDQWHLLLKARSIYIHENFTRSILFGQQRYIDLITTTLTR